MTIAFFARENHHIAHAKAIADGFGLDVKSDSKGLAEDVIVVFCYGDLKKITTEYPKKKIIFCEHGVGMYYDNVHPSYAGSKEHRENVILRLSPNKMHADKEMETLKCPVEIVGIPKLDKFAKRIFRFKKYRPTIALSFHWDCLVNPETRSSFKYFEKILPILKREYDVIGHGHPRIMAKLIPIYRKWGIQYFHNFETILKKADVYICDNSSTIFEWCITKKPVVLLNPPTYRKDVEHKGNPRFWKHAGIAPLCERPEDIITCIQDAIENHGKYLPKIEEANLDVLTYTDGHCARRAFTAISNLLGLDDDYFKESDVNLIGS